MKILLDFSTAANDEYLFNYSFFECIIKPLEKFDTIVYVIVSSELYEKIKDIDLYRNIKFLSINLTKYVDCGYAIENVFYYLYTENNKEKYFSNISKIYKEILNDIIPEIVITFEFGNCVLQNMFPEALNLVYFGGLWKSVPPDFSVCFDPINSVSYSSLIKFNNEIKSFKITDEQNKKIECLKKIFIDNVRNTNIAKKEILSVKKKYNKLILLPLQLQGYMFENECDFKSQKEYFEYVMNKIPSDIGVIVTGHFGDISFIENYIKQNKKIYSNAIVIKELFNHPPQTSLYVLPYIDGMINVCSSLVLKGLLCGVKIFSLGKNYNIWCQDFHNIEDIREKLAQPKINKNNILYWYLTHYDINTSKIKSDSFLYKYILNMYKKRKKVDFNYFEEIISIDEVIDYYKNINYTKKFDKIKISFYKRILFKIYKLMNIIYYKILRRKNVNKR